jgi:hypothetical protein
MTVASEVNRAGPYACNGTTVIFPFGFKIYDQSHVKVILIDSVGVETVLILGTDYSVTGVDNDAGGSIVAATAYPAGKTITILLDVPFTQDIDLENQGAYYAEVVERGFDLVMQRLLQLKERMNRAFTAPPNYTEGATMDPEILGQVSGNASAILAAAEAVSSQVAFATAAAGTATTKASEAAASAATAQSFSGVARRVISFTATAGQTVFPLGETLANPAACDVYHEGVKFPLGSDNYTLTSTTLTLTNAAGAGEKVEVFVISSFAVAGALIPANNLSDVANQASARSNLGLGSAAVMAAGAAAGNVPVLDGNAKLVLSEFPSGSIVGRAYAEYAAQTTYSSSIPIDATPPQSNEGTQFLTLAYIPKVSGSKLRINFQGMMSNVSGGFWGQLAAFLNSAPDAFVSQTVYLATGDGSYAVQMVAEVTPSGLTAQTISLRIGCNGGSVFFNQHGMGGTQKATLIIEEIAP